MTEIVVKYRTWYAGSAPAPIRLAIPGWTGEHRDHSDGATPQPWHCHPFVEGSTYGRELVYSFASECTVTRAGDAIVFAGDFSSEEWNSEKKGGLSADGGRKNTPPMVSFAPGHYGMSSCLDLEPPEGYLIRTEPHPSFYTDETGTVPCMLPGHIRRWWSKFFFVVFKAPREGETHVFRPGEPCGQVLVVPEKNRARVRYEEFTAEELAAREARAAVIASGRPRIATHAWRDDRGQPFDNAYKVMAAAYARGGYPELDRMMSERAGTD